jgi:2-polyprenyl-3-methyl-5-hydroxy-6-metoxy-1,4-benzoquinol methylase
MNEQAHWEHVYQTKDPEQVSWFQPAASLSCELIQGLAPTRDARILDVGAGASRLVDGLLAAGFHRLTVLDVSAAALGVAQRRLGSSAATVDWRQADVLVAELPEHAFDVWHDRALFHFLTEPAARARYVGQVCRALKPGGAVVVATFAEDGPTRCSGMAVCRYSPVALHREFGAGFRLVDSHRESHQTPSGAVQAFTYCVLRYEPQTLAQEAA